MPQFALSYARRDGIPDVTKLFDALCSRLRKIRPDFGDPPGFMDQNIEVGENWADTLAEDFRTAPVLVPLFSPSYFSSDPCGREMEIFLSRLEAMSQPRPEAILPVVWIRKNLVVHEAVKHIQYYHRAFPPEYAKFDLDRMIKISDLGNSFLKFVDAFADRISDVIPRDGPVLAGAPPLDYHTVPSAWRRKEQGSALPSGPNTVQMVFIAATAKELAPIRSPEALVGYGGDPRDWCAFRPPHARAVGLIANAIVVDEGFYYEPMPFDQHIFERIRAAERTRKIVVLVVDSWVVHLPPYRELLDQFEAFNYRNCTVLVPLNAADAESQARREDLLKKLSDTFYFRSKTTAEAPFYRAPIGSCEEFDIQLRKVLASIKASIMNASGSEHASGPPTF
ncbi:MAG TPA: FxsC protein [Bryobacteraceae bacterium]